MGINGLLLNIKSIGVRKNIKDYAGKSVAIDGYSWLHKALHTCGVDVAVNQNLHKFVRYFENKLQYLLSFDINVLVVFDGDKLPLKISTETSRHQNRQKCYAMAMEFHRKGNIDEANKLFSQAIDISPSMARFVKQKINEKLKGKVQFLVAPYEADSQLAYLSRCGLVDLIITEDSDLLVFGASKMMYKMDKEFWGTEIELCRLEGCIEFSFKGWDQDKFIFFCILSGCDYLESPRGIGIKKAYSIIARVQGLEELFIELGERANEEYRLRFQAAFLAFKYQRVYCPREKRIVTLNAFDPAAVTVESSTDYLAFKLCLGFFQNLDFLGKVYKPEVAARIAHCEIDPISKEPFLDEFDALYNSKKRLLQGPKLVRSFTQRVVASRERKHLETTPSQPARLEPCIFVEEREKREERVRIARRTMKTPHNDHEMDIEQNFNGFFIKEQKNRTGPNGTASKNFIPTHAHNNWENQIVPRFLQKSQDASRGSASRESTAATETNASIDEIMQRFKIENELCRLDAAKILEAFYSKFDPCTP